MAGRPAGIPAVRPTSWLTCAPSNDYINFRCVRKKIAIFVWSEVTSVAN